MADEAEKLRQRAAMRAAVKKEFIKQAYNPHRHASGEGGFLFDPALQRFLSMRVTHYEYFKPTPKSSLIGFGLLVVPIVGYALFMKYHHDDFERQCSTGQIAYKDRRNKFV
ncbi:hypothetical protein SK128_017104 [Halocaridina rubra]|uniref:NADH dehydrogenase [ubiquinone] 1 beta subcomplex subunit 4 n=1 Tax=Halocaridina rubra TaxID=373956 RepID=A0AAN8XIC1_HALRR